MKRLACISILAAWFMLGNISSASAQFHFGVKAGATVPNLALDDLKSSSIAGFTGGLMMEFIVPGIGLGVDASVLYARKGGAVSVGSLISGDSKIRQTFDYLDIPIYLKWKVGFPIIKLIVMTGPNFGFLLNDNFDLGLGDALASKTFEFSWNVGGGIELFEKVQVTAAYSWGLTSVLKNEAFDIRNKGWIFSAAYLF